MINEEYEKGIKTERERIIKLIEGLCLIGINWNNLREKLKEKIEEK